MDKLNTIFQNINFYFTEKEPIFKKPDAYKNVNTSQSK